MSKQTLAQQLKALSDDDRKKYKKLFFKHPDVNPLTQTKIQYGKITYNTLSKELGDPEKETKREENSEEKVDKKSKNTKKGKNTKEEKGEEKVEEKSEDKVDKKSKNTKKGKNT